MDKEFQLKIEPESLNQQGEFLAYAAVYGVVDAVGDIIRPGAFIELVASMAAAGKYPAIVWNHDKTLPIGQQILESDERGLKVRGQLWIADTADHLAVEQARQAYNLLNNTNYYMSFWSTDWDYVYDGENRVITVVRNLMETSILTHPANRECGVYMVKDGDLKSELTVARRELAVMQGLTDLGRRLDDWHLSIKGIGS